MSVTAPNSAVMDFLMNGASLGTPLLAPSTTCNLGHCGPATNSHRHFVTKAGPRSR